MNLANGLRKVNLHIILVGDIDRFLSEVTGL
jgi:hypothetical protein